MLEVFTNEELGLEVIKDDEDPATGQPAFVEVIFDGKMLCRFEAILTKKPGVDGQLTTAINLIQIDESATLTVN